MSYHVVVTRDGDGWMADVPAIPGTHTWAKTLRALDRNIREVIGMVEDLPRSAEASLDLGIEYRTGDPDLDARSSELRARRREIERNAAEVAERDPRTRRAARRAVAGQRHRHSPRRVQGQGHPAPGTPSTEHPQEGSRNKHRPLNPNPGPRFRDCVVLIGLAKDSLQTACPPSSTAGLMVPWNSRPLAGEASVDLAPAGVWRLRHARRAPCGRIVSSRRGLRCIKIQLGCLSAGQ